MAWDLEMPGALEPMMVRESARRSVDFSARLKE